MEHVVCDEIVFVIKSYWDTSFYIILELYTQPYLVHVW